MLNITAIQAVPHSLPYSKQLTIYFGNNQLNITPGKKYDNFSCPSYKHNSVHIQFCTFYVLSVCQMMRLNLCPTDGPSRHTIYWTANGWLPSLILFPQTVISLGAKARFYPNCKLSRNNSLRAISRPNIRAVFVQLLHPITDLQNAYASFPVYFFPPVNSHHQTFHYQDWNLILWQY
jgi:hypothetical protein